MAIRHTYTAVYCCNISDSAKNIFQISSSNSRLETAGPVSTGPLTYAG